MRLAALVALIALALQPARPRVEVLRSVGGLPAHIAGAFLRPIGFQQADSGQYFVFDRRAHAVYTVTGDVVKKIIEVGAEEGKVLDPGAFDIDVTDGSFIIADGFYLQNKQLPRLTLDNYVLNGVGSAQYTGQTILINQPEANSLITELAFDGTPKRTIGLLRATGQADRNVHLAFNTGFPLVDPKGGFYFVFNAGVPIFRKYDAAGKLIFERHIEGVEMDPYLRTMPTTWPTRRTDQGDVLPLVEPAIRAASVDRNGRLWIALTAPFTYVYDSTGDKIRTVQFKGADVLTPNSLFFTKDGRILVTPGCYEFKVPAF